MEEDKAAAYYEELTRKGEGAARFKQGLGFSSSSSSSAPKIDKAPSSSFLTSFVKASSPSPTCHKQAHLHSIHTKLSHKKPISSSSSPILKHTDTHRDTYRDHRDHRDHRDRIRDRDHRHRRRSSSRDRERRRRRSRSPSDDSDRERTRQSRRRSVSPGKRDSVIKGRNRKNVGFDYAKLIHGYDKMSPAERVKAKMKFQLSETAEKDAKNGMGSGWERFDFDKDAPLDDEEMEVTDDDVALVKHIGQSFRFSTVEANRVDQIKAAHDEAMFGSSRALPSIHTEPIIEQEKEIKKESAPATSLLSDKVIAGQGGSWRDRARKA